MKIFECKCGSKEIFIKENGNHKGLYCAECGKWIQWLGKDDLRLAERQMEIKNDFTDDLLNMGYTKGIKDGYNQALEDFIEKVCSLRIYDNDLNLTDLEEAKNQLTK